MRLKQLGKDSLIYGVGGAVGKGVALILLPVYTAIFSPADYGLIEMMAVIVGFLFSLLVLGTDSAQSYFFFEQKKKGVLNQKKVISSIFKFRLIWGLCVLLVAVSLSPFLNLWFFDGKLGWEFFVVAFLGALFSVFLGQGVDLFRLLYKPWFYVGLTITGSLLTAAVALVLILVFGYGVLGYFLGVCVSSLFVAIGAWFFLREYLTSGSFSWKWMVKLLKFSVPLFPAGIAYYFMSTMDRWFVQHFSGLEELGIYAVGAKFAIVITLFVETFRKAWWPMAMDSMHSRDGVEMFRLISRLYTGVGVTGIILLALLSPIIIEWLTVQSFHQAWMLIGILAWQSLFYGAFLIVSAGIWRSEKTHLTLYLMIGAALLNFGLNYAFVPLYGGIGAAIATAVTYFVWIVVSLVISERLWRVGFPCVILLLQVAVGAVWLFFFLAYRDIQGLATYSVTLLVCCVLLYSSLDKKHRRLLFHYLGERLKK